MQKWLSFQPKTIEFFEDLAELVSGWLLTDNYAADGRADECMAGCRQTIK